MHECRRIADRLPSYVDGELTSGEQADVERHLAACPACRRSAGREQGGRAILRGRAMVLRAAPLPPGLERRCEALARAYAGRSRAVSRLRWIGLACAGAAGALICGLSVLAVLTSRSDRLLAAQLTVDHSRCFSRFAPAGASAASARQLEHMLAERYGWRLTIPPSSTEAGVQLVGARRCLWAEGRVPHIMYRIDGHDVSLYMLEGVSRHDADVVALGHRSRMWTRGDTTYVLVSRADAGDLNEGMQYVRRATGAR